MRQGILGSDFYLATPTKVVSDFGWSSLSATD
jgi:hypothetical protein